MKGSGQQVSTTEYVLGDTLGHAAVLGVGLGLLLEVAPIFGVLAIVIVLVISLARVSRFNSALTETSLAIISHTGLAAGVILLGLLPNQNVNLESILFGDLLAITLDDLKILLLTTLALLAGLIVHWRAFLAQKEPFSSDPNISFENLRVVFGSLPI